MIVPEVFILFFATAFIKMTPKQNVDVDLTMCWKIVGDLSMGLLQISPKKYFPTVVGSLTDGATLGITTFLGSIACAGPAGVCAGAVVGAGLLGISKTMGIGNYKSALDVYSNDLTEEEQKKFSVFCPNLKTDFSSLLGVQSTDSAVMPKKTVEILEKNLEKMGTITKFNETFPENKMILAEKQ